MVEYETRVAVSVDIEDWYHGPAVTGSPFARFASVDQFLSAWQGKRYYISEATERTLALLDEMSIKATFFVVGDIVDHYPGLAERVKSAGHEIGCHGLHHACKIDPKSKQPLLSRKEFTEATRIAKQTLEDACGQVVRGYRAPSAYVAGWMLDCLEEVGFLYDSSVSVNSVYNKTDSSLVGVSTNPYIPRRGGLLPGSERSLVELPWAYLKVGPLLLPASGGPFLRLLGRHYIAAGIRQSLRRGDTVFYFHPLDICRERFPSPFSSRRPFYWAIRGELVERRIRKLLASFEGRISTCGEIAEMYLGEAT